MNRTWLQRFKQFSQTSIWRFTLIFTGVVLFVSSATLTVVYYLTIGEQRRELEQRSTLAAQGFIDLTSADSITDADLIDAILERNQDDRSLVLVIDHASGVIGKLHYFPQGIPEFPRVTHFPVERITSRGESRTEIIVGSRLVTPFGELLVGFYEDRQIRLEQRYFRVSAVVLSASLLISLIAGLIYNRRVLARVTTMGAQLSDVQSGQLKTRLSVSTRQDEYDLLSGHINAMLDEIDELVDSVSSVTDNIAHDLRTPISRIRIQVESMLEQPSGTDNRAALHLLLEDLDHVIETFNAMLELSRLEKGTLAEQYQPCDLNKICRDVIELIEPIAEDKLQLTYDLVAMGENQIMGSPHLLFRAIYNLIDNAVRYTPAGGQVTLRLEGTCVSVSDNGPGIPQDQHEKVFQRLTRLDTSRQSKGFGLGLSIVRAIVKLHRGEIELVDNQPGLSININFQPDP